ncbi:cytochrome o ubiquinol oxidase subunit III [Paraburkholderia caballeronis]|uniref:Cytochrome bo(3) ubiquinol oxidase subunit 3 n=1 Tax=Paraburkholderia caballeronis TaxID=416943 RepID=A0A1H7QK66_9BURK|nr:cytochrome o ubiquinol oxidase subunit III [Paraburkholderia caballeronis]PXW22509.1 cytochrome o ubiquinol oxidase subunit 3 [Paraburkholderia caballeronis]PXW96380.1 cytochrome o ubiquinol oxidase subunit 3 [Paraburkholderia caballeronis]RAJ92791.1 cytochrome o ubiquinol oxidase subunit 3 [Paraburkholderia caballeronis]TDV15049.1 cytochrome o ubiquinol oxidase subunit 3 [Paraburkholderia caballeronis]TDV16826.1 cytochrome o ubiquinol oxidase subunit 3 [Paraburkholderia caballeronis]
MLQKTNAATLAEHDYNEHPESHSVFGFWVYLMTDCILFASLFAVFGVMAHQFAGGPTGKDLFDIPGVALETGVLLLSSITYGFAMLGAHQRKSGTVLGWLAVTFALGVTFLVIELREFSHLIEQGAGPDRSAFLSSFFALVSTHGLHVFTGLIWMVVLMVQVVRSQNLGEQEVRRLTCLSLFWHFLDVVWICVFTFVYLGSVL